MQINKMINIGELIEALPEVKLQHSPETKIYKLLDKISHALFESSNFRSEEVKFEKISNFGEVTFPYLKMGSVSSVDVFSSLNELIIISFYLINRQKYKRVIDIGANIGLHSILMAKLGWNVIAYEPDPVHINILKRNINNNNLNNIQVIESAVSSKNGKTSFIRVIGNTTSSHIAGSKDAPYGDLETIEVNLVNISEVLSNIDFIKIDAEGHEAEIIRAIPKLEFMHLDAMVEVGSESNAIKIFEYCKNIGLYLFSQKSGWAVVNSIQEMPLHYKEGSLFISPKSKMCWSGY